MINYLRTLLFIIIVVPNLMGEDIQTPFSRYGLNGGIDVPSAYLMAHGNIIYTHTLNFATKSDYKQKNMQTFSLTFGLYNYVQANVSYYQGHYVCANFQALLLTEDKYYYIPQVVIGIDNVGGTTQFSSNLPDYLRDDQNGVLTWENWWNHRNYMVDPYVVDFEKNSIYVVFGKKFVFGKQFIRFNLGFSPNNGRYYGMGPKSFYVKRTFYNFEYSPFYNLRTIWEQDGRDWNVGLKYTINRMFSLHAAVTEIEHFDDWIGAFFHVGFSISLVPNFIAIQQRQREYNMLVQSRIEEANRMDQLYQETVRKRILLENRFSGIRLNIDRILANQQTQDRQLFYERQLMNESDYYIKLALELAYYGEYEAAREHAVRAIEIYPKNPLAYLRLGEIYLKSGDKAKALETWKNGLLIDPQNVDLLESIQRYEQ